MTIYPATAKGNVPPVATIAGPDTGLSEPSGLAVDDSGNIYVANLDNGSPLGTITVYAAGASGDAKPIETITGNYTDLSAPYDVAIDPSNGDMYVVNQFGSLSSSGYVTVFAPGANGNVSPSATIAGASTEIDEPESVAFDTSGNLYVGNNEGQYNNFGSITVYAVGTSGDAAPSKLIAGRKTKLHCPEGLVTDGSGNIYDANYCGDIGGAGDNITEYSSSANGDVKPMRDLIGPNTKIDGPDGVALDSAGNLYVANGEGRSITVYDATAKKNDKPIRIIKGSKTGLMGPGRIAIH